MMREVNDVHDLEEEHQKVEETSGQPQKTENEGPKQVGCKRQQKSQVSKFDGCQAIELACPDSP